MSAPIYRQIQKKNHQAELRLPYKCPPFIGVHTM